MSNVTIVFIERWNGDYTNRFVYNVFENMEVARQHMFDNQQYLKPFDKVKYQTWTVTNS